MALAAISGPVLRVFFLEPRPRGRDVRGHAVDVLAFQLFCSRHRRHRHRLVGRHVSRAVLDYARGSHLATTDRGCGNHGETHFTQKYFQIFRRRVSGWWKRAQQFVSRILGRRVLR